jgi:hypothetical protein
MTSNQCEIPEVDATSLPGNTRTRCDWVPEPGATRSQIDLESCDKIPRDSRSPGMVLGRDTTVRRPSSQLPAGAEICGSFLGNRVPWQKLVAVVVSVFGLVVLLAGVSTKLKASVGARSVW